MRYEWIVERWHTGRWNPVSYHIGQKDAERAAAMLQGKVRVRELHPERHNEIADL